MASFDTKNPHFLGYLTIFFIGCGLYIFSPFLMYILVGASLALATSHGFTALCKLIEKRCKFFWLIRNKRLVVSLLFSLFFLLLIFLPLLYFLTVTLSQLTGIDTAQAKITVLDIWNRLTAFAANIPYIDTIIAKVKAEGAAFIVGNSAEVILRTTQNTVSSIGALIVQIGWILIFYFLCNLFGDKILHFLATLLPSTSNHERYLYKECTGTVAVVFYGTLFNMLAQGVAFALLLSFIGGYDTLYLGVLSGFCSIIPIVGAALIYVPVASLEILHGSWFHACIIVIYSIIVMGFFIDNILRMLFINLLKKQFHFDYTMNEILIMLSILAGIATLGFWGLILGPTIIALAIASANLYRDYLDEDEHTPITGCKKEKRGTEKERKESEEREEKA